jgi:hypothetical protein
MQSHIWRSHQIARIYDKAKSYRDLKLVAKLCLAFTHLVVFSSLLEVPYVIVMDTAMGRMEVISGTFVSSFLLVLLFTRMFGPTFYWAFLSPFRWCAYRLSAIKGIFGGIATYFVRSRGWSVVLAIAMGLEGYRHQLPLIEQQPNSVNFVKYEDMPPGVQRRALEKRGAWIYRHLNDIAQTFSKLVVTPADITLLLRAIEADRTLVHAAYYTDDECIARIADWIAAEDSMRSNAAIAGEARGAA